MTKDILIQYSELVEEVKDLRKRIDNIERQIDKIEAEGNVIDSVKGGYGGIQHFKIEGFPDPGYSKKKTRLYLNKAQLESAELELLELTNQVEDYIQSIDNSRMRRIFRLRYIDGKTWLQVAQGIGGRATADSVRMEHDRYMARE